MATTYDVVVLGGGPAGYAFALRAALLGRRIAIVERDKVGGTCLHRGCIPTKALLHASEVMDSINDAEGFGITVADPSFDWARVQRSKSEPIKRLHAGLQSVIKARKIDVIEGNGTLGDRGTILVDGKKEVSGKNVVLAPGSFARSLPGLDPDGERIITSDDALTSEAFPSSIAIIGAGAVGVEFASIYRSFGADVTLIEALDRIIPLEDAELSKELTAAFKKRGIIVHAGAKVEDVDKSDSGVRLAVNTGNKTETIEVDTVLVAVGRGPATDGLELDRWGVRSDRGFIVIDGSNQAADGTYAIGDATAGTPQLAHAAFGQGFATAERLAGGNPVAVDFKRHVPHATYCAPEVASVGLTEEEARTQGYDVEVTKHAFAGIAKAQMMHQARGFSKIVAEKDGPILGIHLIGPRVTELLGEALLTVGWEAMPAEVAAFVHPHPTLSEVIGEAALAAIGRPLHGKGVRGSSTAKAVRSPDQTGGSGVATPVEMPQMGESVVEGTILNWLKKEGDTIEADDALVEVSTDKVDTEIPSPVAGTLTKILVPEGETVDVGTPLCEIDEAGAGAQPATKEPKAEAAEPEPKQEPVEAETQPPAEPAPKRAEQPAEPEATPRPAASAARTTEVEPGQVLSPLVRRLAREHNVDPSQIRGTGTGGRVTKQDVLAYAERGGDGDGRPAAPASAPAPATGAPAAATRATPPAAREAAGERTGSQELSHIRKRIAEHMLNSLHTSARAWNVIEVDMESIAAVRSAANPDFRRREGFSLTFLPFIARATCDALAAHPLTNASVSADVSEVTYHNYVNLGVAVATDYGLIVPVVKGADGLTVVGLARAIRDLADKARDKKLNPDDVGGSTFTITNPGPFGSYVSLPVINQPNVAILSTELVEKRVVVVDDMIAIRHRTFLSMSWDHRLLDGSDAMRFLQRLKENLETWDFSHEVT